MSKDSQDWLDDPLKEILMKHKAWVASGFAPLVDNGLEVYSDSQAEQAIKAHIKQEMLALVGEDDRDYSGDNTDHDSKIFLIAASTACNELRAELRKAILDNYKEV